MVNVIKTGAVIRVPERPDYGGRRVGEPGEHEPDDEHRVVEFEEVDTAGHHHRNQSHTTGLWLCGYGVFLWYTVVATNKNITPV
jgi:hypothetical protein